MSHVANVVIDSTKVSADLTDYPVYIDLSDMPAGFWSTVANGGGDIRVYKSDGTTELPREVVSCDTVTETGQLHVRIDSYSHLATIDLAICVDGVSSDYPVDHAFGRNAVWADYDFALHMDGDVTDSAGNYTPIAYGSPTYSGGGIVLNGTTQYIEIGTTVANQFDEVLLSVDYELDVTNGGSDPQVMFSAYTSTSRVFRYLHDPLNNPDALDNILSGTTDGSAYNGESLGSTTVTGGVRYASHLTRDGATFGVYRDGVSQALTTVVAHVATNTGVTPFYVGSFGSGSGNFDGTIYGIRARSTLPINTAEWITDEYANQSSPSTWYTVSAVGGGATVPTLSLAGVTGITSTSITPQVTVTF